jgi:hypothetical protein
VASLATWKVETITVPSGTGSVAYSFPSWGGKTPKALLFYGTNWLTEDAAVTSNGSGVFRGMAAPKWDALGTILNSAASVVSAPSGNAHHLSNSHCTNQLDTSGGLTFRHGAICTAIVPDGFTLNWDSVTAGGYKVIVVALFDVDNAVGVITMYDGTVRNLGFKAGASILHGAWGGTDIGGADRTQEFYGSAAYRGGNSAAWSVAAGVGVLCFPTSSSGQYVNEIGGSQPPHVYIITGGHFTGPFLVTSNIIAYPTGSPSAGNSFLIGGDSFDGGMVVIFDDEDTEAFRLTPAQAAAATATKTGLPFAPGLLLGYTISDEPPGQGTGARGAIGFGVVTPDFQWCATVDGKSAQGAFQSFQRGIADTVNGSSVHAASIELTDDGFVATTEEAATTTHGVSWHAFGHPDVRPRWLPGIYRRISG